MYLKSFPCIAGPNIYVIYHTSFWKCTKTLLTFHTFSDFFIYQVYHLRQRGGYWTNDSGFHLDWGKVFLIVRPNSYFIENIEAKGQLLAEAEIWSEAFVMCAAEIDGIVGLAYPQASRDHSLTVTETLTRQHKLPHSIFAFKLSSTSTDESILTLGEPDPEYYKHIVYSPVIQWEDVGNITIFCKNV